MLYEMLPFRWKVLIFFLERGVPFLLRTIACGILLWAMQPLSVGSAFVVLCALVLIDFSDGWFHAAKENPIIHR